MRLLQPAQCIPLSVMVQLSWVEFGPEAAWRLSYVVVTGIPPNLAFNSATTMLTKLSRGWGYVKLRRCFTIERATCKIRGQDATAASMASKKILGSGR